MYKLGITISAIVKEIKMHKSTVSREIKRNSCKSGVYNPKKAHEYASIRKERFAKNRTFTDSVKRFVDAKLAEWWSPEQICGYCQANDIPMVSHERIYQYIREDRMKGGKLYSFCRHKLKKRRRPVGIKVPIKNRIDIDLRPLEANGKRFGDWEMDLIVDKNSKNVIVNLVERFTGESFKKTSARQKCKSSC